MRTTVNILGISIDNVTMQQAIKIADGFLKEDSVHTIYTPNSEILMEAYRNKQLKDILLEGDLVIPDGAGVILSSQILGTPLTEKVSGIDLCRNIFSFKKNSKIRFYLFGGKPGVAESATNYLCKNYPSVEVVGHRNGYFSSNEETEIIDLINSSNADIVLVALGAPKQEYWIHENRHTLNAKICIGVGGSLDVFAGKVKPSPEFMRKNGLEWLYRLYKEPWRYKRMLDIPKFILLTIAVKLGIKRLN